MRAAYYADLAQLQRIRLHAAAARDLDENGEPELAGEAARHLLSAGDRDGAAHLLVRAASHAMSFGALSRAEELLTESSGLQPSNIEIVLELAGIAAHRGMADLARSAIRTRGHRPRRRRRSARHGDRAYSLGGVEYRPAMPPSRCRSALGQHGFRRA